MSAAIDAGMMNMAANDKPVLPRALVPLLVTAAALITALFAGRAVQPALNRPLTALRVEGALTHLSAAQIATAASVADHAHIFDADLGVLRSRVEALPWVGRARVSRTWPDTLDIRVWERVPAARWGDDELLDTEGAAFTPPAEDLQPASIQALPKLTGPSSREAEVMTAYRSLNDALHGSEFEPAGLALDARGEWRMTTAHDIELRLGTNDPLAHVPLLLGTVSHTLAAYLEQIAYIDLRYSNGFSVGWINGGECDPLHRAAAKGKASAAVVSCGGTATGTPVPETAAPADDAAVAAPTAALDESATPAKPTRAKTAPKTPTESAVVSPKAKAHAVAPATREGTKK